MILSTTQKHQVFNLQRSTIYVKFTLWISCVQGRSFLELFSELGLQESYRTKIDISLDAQLLLTTCVLSVLQGSRRSSNCYSDWRRISLHFYTVNSIREGHSQPWMSKLVCRNHTEPRITYIYCWTIQKHLYFKLQNNKICLGVHYSLFVFSQSNLGFVYNANYACLNIKNKVPNSELLKLILHRKLLLTGWR